PGQEGLPRQGRQEAVRAREGGEGQGEGAAGEVKSSGCWTPLRCLESATPTAPKHGRFLVKMLRRHSEGKQRAPVWAN
ncbi:hypothetical protein THAOC_11537, partial [Thalassiosira oceanica]